MASLPGAVVLGFFDAACAGTAASSTPHKPAIKRPYPGCFDIEPACHGGGGTALPRYFALPDAAARNPRNRLCDLRQDAVPCTVLPDRRQPVRIAAGLEMTCQICELE